MKLSFAILAAIATIASAQQQRPSPPKQTQQRPPPPKQQQPNIALMEVWTGQKHEGSHHVSHGHPNQCYNLPEEWENKVSSAKAKQGYVCTLYRYVRDSVLQDFETFGFN